MESIICFSLFSFFSGIAWGTFCFLSGIPDVERFSVSLVLCNAVLLSLGALFFLAKYAVGEIKKLKG